MSKIMIHYDFLGQGGTERVITNLANAWAKGDDEIIVTTEWYGENEYELDPRVTRLHVGLKPEEEQVGRLRKAFIRVRNLRKCLKTEKPDVVIGFTKNPIFRLLMAAKGVHVPIVIAVRADPWYVYNNRSTKLGIRLLYPRVNGAVWQTNLQSTFFPKYLKNKSVVILNPINEKYFDDAANYPTEKVVMSTGRLVAFKNQAMLLRAFIRIHDEFPDYTLELFGADSLDGTKEILEDIVAKNNAAGYIKLMGGSNNLEKELPRAEIFAYSSNSEGMPNSLLEAMCMGLPCVATDCPSGGPADVIEDGVNGLLTKVGDEEAFAAAMARLLRDKEAAREMGRNARKIRDIASSEYILTKWRAFLDEVILNYNK